MILAINTIGAYCDIGLGFYTQTARGEKEEIAFRSEKIGRGHAEILPLQLADLAEETQCNFQQLKTIIVNVGPGSFTGIRIGIALARSLALVSKAQLQGISQFQALAFYAQSSDNSLGHKNIYIVLPASKEYFYIQLFSYNSTLQAWEGALPIQCLNTNDLLDFLRQKHKALFVGASLKQFKEFCTTFNVNTLIIEDDHIPVPSFFQIAQQHKGFLPPTPLYLRNAVGQTPASRFFLV